MITTSSREGFFTGQVFFNLDELDRRGLRHSPFFEGAPPDRVGLERALRRNDANFTQKNKIGVEGPTIVGDELQTLEVT